MEHWSGKEEQAGSLWQIRLFFALYRKLGFDGMRILLYPVAFFFFLFSPSARRVSRSFLSKVHRKLEISRNPGMGDVYRHIYSFSYSLLEKLVAWAGDMHSSELLEMTEDIATLKRQLSEKQGAVIICSHLGNIEMLRAFANHETGDYIPQFGVHSVVDFSVTGTFNTFMEEVNPDSMVRLVNASTIDPGTIIRLQDNINKGDLVVIAGDRTAKNNMANNTEMTFIGETAYFPQGTFILANLLEAPVYFMFAVRENDRDFESPYEFHVYRSSVDVGGSRKERKQKILRFTEEFVSHLEALCLKHPYQWYNFFGFWDNPQFKS